MDSNVKLLEKAHAYYIDSFFFIKGIGIYFGSKVFQI